jgi:hypothetical protein
VSGDTVDPTFTGGLYLNGTTDLDVMAVTAGYMIVDDRFEVVASWDSLDADNYQEAWQRTTAGANYYWHEHDIKAMLDFRRSTSFLGLRDQDQNLILAMMQFVF